MIRKRKPHEPWGRPYDFLRRYLATTGFVVYPTEIIVDLTGVPDRTTWHPCLDVAATKKGDYYAFEFKSASEGLQNRVLEQIECYRRSFDYVIVVLERGNYQNGKPKGPLTPKSKYYSKLQKVGVGLWCICAGKYITVIEPQRQTPIPENRAWIDEKFHRYVFKDLPFEVTDPRQKRLIAYL